MMRFLKNIFTALVPSTDNSTQIKWEDPKETLFSLATINDSLPATDEAPTAKDDFIIHEDDWRQFEAVSQTLNAQINEELADIQYIYDKKSESVEDFRVFSEIHKRKRIDTPLPSPIVWDELLQAAGVTEDSVSGVGIREEEGMIIDGFSFNVGSLTIYGVKHGENVNVLCLNLMYSPGLNENDAERLATYFDENNIVLVHWPIAKVMSDKETLKKYFQLDEKP